MRKFPLLMVLLVAACGAKVTASQTQADRFMDTYYMKADLEAAQGMADGLALDKITKSRELIKDVQMGTAQANRKVAYKLDKSKEDGEEAEYIYSVDIDAMGVKSAQVTRLRLRKRGGDWKITQFSDLSADAPSETR